MMISLGFALTQFRLVSYSLTLLSTLRYFVDVAAAKMKLTPLSNKRLISIYRLPQDPKNLIDAPGVYSIIYGKRRKFFNRYQAREKLRQRNHDWLLFAAD